MPQALVPHAERVRGHRSAMSLPLSGLTGGAAKKTRALSLQ